jgi:DNA-binding response OmpR family regulator
MRFFSLFIGYTANIGGDAMKSILVIEDEEAVASLLQSELTREGYEVGVATDGKMGLDQAFQRNWDLIILDVVLPKLNGMEVLRRVRKVDPTLPIIIITARNEILDIVSGLDQGANDYITKPFMIEVLLARVRVCLRNQQYTRSTETEKSNEWISVNGLTVNIKTREVSRDDIKMELTMKEFDLLVFLMENQPNVVTREQIIQQVWGYEFVGNTNIVDVYIRYLRKKVDYNFEVPLIQTIRGVGYCIRYEPLI